MGVIRLLIYNQEIYERIQTTGYGFDLKTELTQESWRIKVKEVYYYEYGTENLFEKHKTYLWIDIGMIPKSERIIGCASINKNQRTYQTKMVAKMTRMQQYMQLVKYAELCWGEL